MGIRIGSMIGIGRHGGVRLSGGGYAFDYYVDSVNGDDANDGLAPNTAFATIGALPTLEAGDRIGLAKGSHWREQLTLPANNITVAAYGTGNRPILDASDVIDGGDWSATSGQTNVYEVSKVIVTSVIDPFVRVYEDDTVLTLAADVADCDATPGSYYVASHSSTPVTIYIHPSDSDNPTSNGAVYEYTTRSTGIDADSRSGIVIDGIETRRNVRGSGSVIVGRNARLTHCIFRDGGKHNVFVADGSVLTDCEGIDLFFGGGEATIFILFEQTPASLGVNFTRCVARQTGAGANVTGFFSHHGTSGDFGTVTMIDCEAHGCAVGYSFTDVAQHLYVGCDAQNCSVAYRAQTNNPAIYTDCQCQSSGRTTAFDLHPVVEINEAMVCVLESAAGALQLRDGANVTLTNSIFRNTGAGANARVGISAVNTNLTASIDISNCVFDSFFRHYDWMETPTITLTSDNNQFTENAMRIAGTAYADITAYKAGTGQDANSTVVEAGAGAAACT